MLTLSEIEHFMAFGFVLKKGLISKDLLDAAQPIIWAKLPESFRPDNPDSWNANINDCRGDMAPTDRFGLVKLRNEIHRCREVADITTRNPDIRVVAEQFLGVGTVADSQKFRGIYPIFPTPEHKQVAVNGHIDETPTKFRISVGVYLNDTPADGGGLMVWPKSHRSLHFLTRTDGCLYEDMASPEFLEGFHAWNRTEPVIIPVEAGDVIFFHYRLLHGPSLNLRANHVRLAAYFNIHKSDDATGPVGGLWDGWDGVEALGLPAYAETNRTPLPIPEPEEWSDFRRHLPEGGAHISYANFLTRWVNRLQREAQAAAKPVSLDWWYDLQTKSGSLDLL